MLNLDRLESRRLMAADGTAAFGQLPISFEQNVGQTAAEVQYLARSSGYTLFLTGNSAVFRLTQDNTPASPAGLAPQVTQATVTTSFVGAHQGLVGQSGAAVAGETNYLIGKDPSSWITGVTSYAGVTYAGLYDGIDLVYHAGAGGGLEYDYVVAPGANASQIHQSIGGASSVALDAAGDLVIGTAAGSLIEKAPVSYQMIGGKQVAVASAFSIAADGTVGFTFGAYDHTAPLVIDPTLAYSTYLGGSGVDYANGVAVDSSGSAYVVGFTSSIDFPTTAGTLQGSSGGSSDAFVTKLSADGTSRVYSTYLGGSGADVARGVAVDSSGSAYIVGVTDSTNFATTPGAAQTSSGGSGDAFVTKLSADGKSLAYSTYLGGSSAENAYGVAVDSSGSAYVVGQTASNNFPTTAGALQGSYGGNIDGFVTKLSADGSSRVYSTYIGGNRNDVAYGVAVDSSGSAYVVGSTTTTNFATTAGAAQTAYGGAGDAFVTKLSAGGNSRVYSTYLGGSGADVARGVAVDSSGSAYIVGNTASTNLPTTTGAAQTTYGGGATDAFVTKLSADGTSRVYSTYLGGSTTDEAYGVAVDASGLAYVVGDTDSTNFGTTAGAAQTTYGGSTDAYLTKLAADGSSRIYSTYLGGSGSDYGYGLAVDGSKSAYIVGQTASTDFPTTAGAAQTTSGGSTDAFVTKLDARANSALALSKSVTSPVYGQSVTYTAALSVAGVGTPLSGGTVTFSEGATILAADVPISGSSASFSTAALSAGPHTITASYSGTNANQPTSTTLSFSISTRTLTVTASASSKVYDGTTTATGVVLSDDRVSGDSLTVGYASANFDTKNVGTGKTVTVSGITLSGAAAGNYTLASTTATTTADITKATPAFSGLTASPTIVAGTPSTTLSGTILGNGTPPPGSVTITINGSSHTAAISAADGSFSVSFPTSTLTVSGSPYAIAYSYSAATNGATNFYDATTNTSTTLTVQARPFSVLTAYTTTAFAGIATGSIHLVDFTDPYAQTIPTSYTATIDWGDGIIESNVPVSPSSVSGTTIQIMGSHTYASGGTYHPIVTLKDANGSSLTTTPGQTAELDVATDATNKVSITRSGLIKNRTTGLYYSTLTVNNISGSSLVGDLDVVLTGLSSGVTLTNATGTTGGGTTPYVRVNSGTLAAGASVSFQLVFSLPSTMSTVNYSTKTFLA